MGPIHPALAPLADAAKRRHWAEVDAALNGCLRERGWLRPEHRVGDPTHYMRHVLYVDPEGDFVMTCITWLPGQVSPLHGHQVWCVFGVAEGEMTEERFRLAGGVPQPAGSRVYRAGEAAEKDLEQQAIHRVFNRSRDTLVSLHLYGVAAERLTTGINRLYPAT